MPPSMDESSDPLSRVIAPPANETEEEREVRLSKEKRAKLVSDAIDEEIEAERMAEKKGPKPVKVLLLGQSESGKSTTLKNFQLMYDPKAFRREKASWRAVIQLNLVRSFRLIINAITRAQQAALTSESREDLIAISPDLLKTKMRLAPLTNIEEILVRRLTPVGSGESEPTQLDSNSSYTERTRNYIKEIAVNSANQWKDTFNRFVRPDSPESLEDGDGIDWDDPNDPGRVLHECAEDMVKLWNDPVTQQLLARQNLRMQEVAGFFLDQLERVTAPRYVPTDDDVLRARLKTLGVSEHRFTLKTTGDLISRDWRVFDVGGHRSQVDHLRPDLRNHNANLVFVVMQRAAWVPYFDDMDAIIFLAPISCFDQTLAEDTKTNRLHDSVVLWKSLAKNQLLKNTNLILFLNKVDIFREKLAAGIKFSDYVVSYGDRPNDYDHITNYLRRKFGGILRDDSPQPRSFYCHLTTVTDTQSTKFILINLEEMLMRNSLVKTNLVL